MAAYKTATYKIKKADIIALASTAVIAKNIGTLTGETVTALTGIAMLDLDGVNVAITVSYTV